MESTFVAVLTEHRPMMELSHDIQQRHQRGRDGHQGPALPGGPGDVGCDGLVCLDQMTRYLAEDAHKTVLDEDTRT